MAKKEANFCFPQETENKVSSYLILFQRPDQPPWRTGSYLCTDRTRASLVGTATCPESWLWQAVKERRSEADKYRISTTGL